MTQTAVEQAPVLPISEPPKWPKGLLLSTVGLLILAPLVTLSGRVAGMAEIDYPIFFRLFFFNDYTASLAMLLAFLVALLVAPIREHVAVLASVVGKRPIATASITFVALAGLALVVYRGFPLAMDEFAPLLQARIFATGNVAAAYPPELLDHMVVPGFQGSFLHVNHVTGQVISGYWPGLAMLMTPFASFGAEWLLNPLFGAIGLLLIGDLAKQASGHEDARGWAMLAALASPQYTVNAISFYAMPGLLTLNLLFVWLLMRPGARHAAMAGVVGSLALVMHNPVPHALMAAPCIVWMLADKDRRIQVFPLAAGYLPLLAALGIGWPLLTSELGMRPIRVAADHDGFFGSWLSLAGSLFSMPTLEFATTRVYAAWKTMIWTAPGVLLLAFVVKMRDPRQKLLIAGLLLTYVFYLFIPFDQGHGWGYRYLHPVWAALPISAGIYAASNCISHRRFMAAAVLAGVLATPVFMQGARETVSLGIKQNLSVPRSGRFIIFIADQPGLYSPDLVRNYPGDSGRIIRMWSRGMDADRTLVQRIAPGSTLFTADRRGSAWAVPPATPFPWH